MYNNFKNNLIAFNSLIQFYFIKNNRFLSLVFITLFKMNNSV